MVEFHSDSARVLQIPLAMLGLFYMLTADKGFGKIRVKSINEFNTFCTSMIIITMISVYTSIVVYHTTIPSDYKQSIVRCYYYVVPFLVAYYSVKKFRNDTPRLLIISGLVWYSTVFIRYVY